MQKYFLHIFIGLAVLMLVAVGFSLSMFRDATDQFFVAPDMSRNTPQIEPGTDESGSRIGAEGSDTKPTVGGKLKADVFTGVLEKVDTGCFADGECYVEVDGRHVTALRGWSQDTVGSVQGVSGFGDLEQYIGKRVEVYAQVNEDMTYTLYGSEGFYIKVLDSKSDKKIDISLSSGCVVGGCSAQLCLDEKDVDGMVTTCEYTAAYGCYQTATCERQTTGACGWTETEDLTQCLDTADGSVDEVYQVQ